MRFQHQFHRADPQPNAVSKFIMIYRVPKSKNRETTGRRKETVFADLYRSLETVHLLIFHVSAEDLCVSVLLRPVQDHRHASS